MRTMFVLMCVCVYVCEAAEEVQVCAVDGVLQELIGREFKVT
jgi:hypothetical protein